MREDLRGLKVLPLAFDSFGVRSMATCVEAGGLKVLIDPGAALGPRRYGLPPHPLELSRLHQLWEKVRDHASVSDVIVITHYHYDHHNPWEPELYRGKAVYIKDPREKINRSQAERASHLLAQLHGIPGSVEVADGRQFHHGTVCISFSSPVFHGTNPRLGYVLEVSISFKGERMVFTSDVEGPSQREQTEFIIQEDPDLLILDGPMTYMLGYRYSRESLDRSLKNISAILSQTHVKTIIADHHLLRDPRYREHMADAYGYAAEVGASILSAAEYAGLEVDMLEARRRELYGADVPRPDR